MAHMDLNKRHIRDMAQVSRENKWYTSQQTLMIIVELVHKCPLADLV